MTIKIQCGCGTKYSFEVEPQNGAMPFRVNCPNCNADGTEAANQVIAQTPVEEQSPQPRLRMQAAALTPPPEIPRVPAPERRASSSRQRLQADAREGRMMGWMILAFFLLCAGALGGWGWYTWIGSKPQMAFAIKLDGAETAYRTEFLDDGKILVAGAGKVTLHEAHSPKDLWSVALPGSSASDTRPPHVFVDKESIWVCPGDDVVRLDRKTGAVKETVPIAGQFSSFTPTPSNILVVASTGETSRAVTQIDLASSDVSTRTITVPRAEKRDMPDELPPNVEPTAGVLLAEATDEQKFNKPLDAVSSEFFSAGQNLVELRVTLLQANVNWVKSIKPRGPTLINGQTTAATSTTGVEEEVFNDIKRDQTGGVKAIDESLYDVKVRRWLGDKPVEWEGQVRGVPYFYSLQTVDFVTAGKSLTVFDKENHPLFNQELSYPISEQLATNHLCPAAERQGVLYFYDQGVLSAFALPGGDVKWRMTTVGVNGLHFDDSGMLYVDTTASSPEDIQYSDEIRFDYIPPVIMKLDPSNGKILWQIQKMGQHCHVSGPFLYTVSVNRGGAAALVGLAGALNAPRPDAPTYFHIRRLDPETGKQLWEFYREEGPDDVGFQKNWFMVRFGDDLQVWKYLSF